MTRNESPPRMRHLSAAEMRGINGGELSTECGLAVALTVASWFFAPMVTWWAAEATVAICATT